MRVYLSGPMQGCDDEQAFGWRRRAAAALDGEVDVFVPTVEDAAEPALMVESDKAEVDASDVVLAYPWKASVGTAMEVLYAWERGKVVVVVEAPGISPWHRYHAHHVVPDEAAACRLLLGEARRAAAVAGRGEGQAGAG